MRNVVLSGAQGLITSGRLMDTAEKGYIAYCDNLLIRAPGVMTPRFGLEDLGSSQANITAVLYDSINRQILRTSYTDARLDKYAGGGSWTSLDATYKYGFEVIPSRNFNYILSDIGLRRINSGNSATEIAYVPEALDLTASTTGSSGWLADNTQVGYVCVWGIKNANNEFFLGAPSGRAIVTNSTGGTRNVSVTVTIPSNITTAYFYQIYRTRTSASSTTDPGADYALVYEAYPTSSEIAALSATITDVASSTFGGPSLYTNQQQQTDLQANYPCEAVVSSAGAGRLAAFADCLFASNYQPRSSLFITLLGTQSINGLNAFATDSATHTNTTLDGIAAADWERLVVGMGVYGADIPANTTIQALPASGTVTLSQAATGTSTTSRTFGDILTIGGVDYYAYTSENVANRQFQVYGSDVSSDIRNTCASLIRVFNQSTSNTIAYMRYLSGPDELPGRMIIYCRSDRASTYTVASTHGMAWTPNLTTAQTILSQGDPGTVLVSKPNEPQAWPLVAYITFAGDTEVYEFSVLRGALLVWTNRGLYRITGSYGAFFTDLIDATAILVKGASTPSLGTVVVDNVAYGLTARGLVAATETSTRIVSDNVAANLTNLTPSTALRISCHPGDGLIFVPISGVGTYVYSTRFQLWTYFSQVLNCGDYDLSTGRQVFYDGTVKRARDATYQAANLYDSTAAITIASISANILTLSATPGSLTVGDYINQSATWSVVTAIDGTAVTVDDAAGFTTGAATAYIGFTVTVRYCPLTSGAGSRKNFVSGNVHFDTAEPASSSPSTYNTTSRKKYVTIGFTTDLTDTSATVSQALETPYSAHEMPFWVPASVKRAAVLTLTVRWRNTCHHVRFLGANVMIDDESPNTRR